MYLNVICALSMINNTHLSPDCSCTPCVKFRNSDQSIENWLLAIVENCDCNCKVFPLLTLVKMIVIHTASNKTVYYNLDKLFAGKYTINWFRD